MSEEVKRPVIIEGDEVSPEEITELFKEKVATQAKKSKPVQSTGLKNEPECEGGMFAINPS